MNAYFHSTCYNEHKHLSLENDEHMGRDFTIVFGLLRSHQRELQRQLVWDGLSIGHRIDAEAKITKIEELINKYRKFIDFVNDVATDEVAL